MAQPDLQAWQHWRRDRRLQQAKRVALYAAYVSEFPTTALIEYLSQQGCEVYLPRIQRHRLQFFSIQYPRCMHPNRYGILEPRRVAQRRIRLNQCDVVVLPLLGYDDMGTRLGTGGGYYDRSLAFRKPRQRWRRPRLLGLAYSAQACVALPRAHWDVPLDAVLTEQSLTWFSP